MRNADVVYLNMLLIMRIVIVFNSSAQWRSVDKFNRLQYVNDLIARETLHYLRIFHLQLSHLHCKYLQITRNNVNMVEPLISDLNISQLLFVIQNKTSFSFENSTTHAQCHNEIINAHAMHHQAIDRIFIEM